MRHLAVFILCAVALTGCIGVPKTPTDLRSMATTSPLVKTEQFVVSRPPSAVASTLRTRSAVCLNFRSRKESLQQSSGPGNMFAGRTNVVEINNFRSNMQSEGSQSTLVVEHETPHHMGEPGWYTMMLADLTPEGSGTRVAITGPMGRGLFKNAISAWANGDTSPCPKNEF